MQVALVHLVPDEAGLSTFRDPEEGFDLIAGGYPSAHQGVSGSSSR